MPVRSAYKTLLGTKTRIGGLGLLVALTFPGCHRSASAVQVGASDPADANFAPVNGTGTPDATYTTAAARPEQVMAQRTVNEAQQQAQDYNGQGGAPQPEQYGQQPGYPQGQYSPQQPGYPQGQYAPQQQPGYPQGQYPQQQPGYDPGYSNPGYANPGYADQGYAPSPEDQEADEYAADLTAEAASEPPPPLPDYEQPPCPDPDYIWTPGYWAWGPAGYYWVPGVWVAAPYTGALWTPGYWAFIGNSYRFHHGFWGLHIGFYGGIDYGYGYTGYGYYGGYWRDRHFFYNTAVNRVNINVVRNVYARNVLVNNMVVNNRIVNRVSYNGGRGGIEVRPRAAELAVLHEQRIPPMQSQLAVRREAEGNRAQFYNQNHGRPQITAAARPVAADRSLPAPLPRPIAGAMMQNGNRQGYRPGAPQGGTDPGNAGTRGFSSPAGPGGRNGQQDNRGLAPGQHPESPRAVEPQGVVRPIQPNNVQQLPNSQSQPYNQGRPDYRQPYSQPAQPQAPGANTTQPYGRFDRRGPQGNAAAPQTPAAQPNVQNNAQPNPQGRPDYGNRGAQPDFRRPGPPQQNQPGPQPQQAQPQFQQRQPQQQAQPQLQQRRPELAPQYQQREQAPQPQYQQRQQPPQPQYQQRQQQQQPQFQQRQQQPQPQFQQRQQPQPQFQQRPQPENRPAPQARNDREERGR